MPIYVLFRMERIVSIMTVTRIVDMDVMPMQLTCNY